MGLASLQPAPLTCSLFSSLSLSATCQDLGICSQGLSFYPDWEEMEVEGVVCGREASFFLSH